MMVQIGLKHALGMRRAFKREIKDEVSANEVGIFLLEAANNGWAPVYVIVDGVNKMRELDNGTYEITI